MIILYRELFILLLVLFTVQIVKVYLDSFFTSNKSSLQLLPWILFSCFQFLVMNGTILNAYLLMLGNVIFVFIICLISYQTHNYRHALFLTIILYAIWMLIEIITNMIIQFTGLTGLSYNFLMGNAISKILVYLTVHIVKKYRRFFTYSTLPGRYWIRLLIVPIFTIIIIQISYRQSVQLHQQLYLMIVIFLLLVINFIIFDVHDQLSSKNELERKNMLYEHQIILSSRQAAKRELAFQETKTLRHDLKQYLLGLKAMIKDGDRENALQTIDLMLEHNDMNKNAYSNSGNHMIDTLINENFSYASANNIVLHSHISVPSKLPFNDIDLCIILGNLLDNAIEANMAIEASQRNIDLSVTFAYGILYIEIKNPFIQKLHQKAFGRFISSKKDFSNHGLGLLSVKHSVEIYDGEMTVHTSDNLFTVTVTLFPNEVQA